MEERYPKIDKDNFAIAGFTSELKAKNIINTLERILEVCQSQEQRENAFKDAYKYCRNAALSSRTDKDSFKDLLKMLAASILLDTFDIG